MKVGVIGSLTVDLFLRPSQTYIMTQSSEEGKKEFLSLPHGGKIVADTIDYKFGGGASNVAVSFARQNFETRIFGGVGDDQNGEDILKNAKQENIETSGVEIISGVKSGFSVIINSFDGERTVIFTSEANKKFSSLKSQYLEDLDAVYLCHLSADLSVDILDGLGNFLEQHTEKKLFWNPGNEVLSRGMAASKKLLSQTQILFLNVEEAELFTQKKALYKKSHGDHLRAGNIASHLTSSLPENIADVSELAAEILRYGVVHVVITDGRNGAQLFSQGKDTFWYCPIDQSQKRVDTLGAGDSFASTFSAQYLAGKKLQECLKYATIQAGSVVSYQGAQDGLLTKSILEQKMNLSDSITPFLV